MSLLNLSHRPYVAFDPGNSEHRQAASIFLAKRSWGHLPFKFALDAEHSDVVAMMTWRLSKYYLTEEFKK